jgi:MATE family multidrug resistance protein
MRLTFAPPVAGRPRRADFARLIDLAIPLVMVQVGLMAMGVVDTLMVGRISAAALGAVAVANVYFFCWTTLGTGCLYVLDPIVSQAVGAQDPVAVTRGFQRGLILSVVVAIPITVALLGTGAVLRFTKQPPEVVTLAVAFMKPILPGVWPYFAFLAFRQVLQVFGAAWPLALIIWLSNLLNAFLDWALIYGKAGFPALGVTGAAIATTISRWAMFIGIAVAGWSWLSHHLFPWRRDALDVGALGRMLRLGLPIGFQMLFEYGVFGMVGLLMGRLSTVALAGHQIAINLASLTFMVPLGVGSAAAVLVGKAVGAGDASGAQRSAWAAVVVGASFMAICGAFFIVWPRPFAWIYTEESAVIAAAVALIPLAGLFQVFDGVQAVACGILRGLGDTRAPVLINLLGYWIIGLPVSLWLGFRLNWGAAGLWWGLVLGLIVAAVILVIRVRLKLNRRLQRIRIDRAEHQAAAP